MIVSHINDCSRYEHLHRHFKTLFDYLKSHDVQSMELGRIELEGDELFINNVLIDAVDKDKQPLEVHHEYIDVHLLFEGSETIGWLPTDKINHYSKEYSAEGDCALTTDAPSTYVTLLPLDMVIVYPEDAHAPAIGSGKIRKIIAKIKL